MKLRKVDIRFKRCPIQDGIQNVSRYRLWEKIYKRCRIDNKRNINEPVQNIIRLNILHPIYVVSLRKIKNLISTI